jgi:probable HAF family extracellular repeat protein
MMTRRPPILIAAAILSALAFAASAQASVQYPYTLVDPGTFGGPNSGFDGPGVPISSNGTLVGTADTTTLDSDYPNCPPPPGGCSDPYIQHAFAWSDGRLRDLGALPGQNDSAIYELNNYGFGVGSSENGLDDPNTGTAAQSAVMFYHGRVINLGTLPGGHESFAQDINDRGEVAGNSSNGINDPYSFFGWGTQTRSFIWHNGVMTDLGTLGGADAVQNNLNQRGQVAGWSYTNNTPNFDSGGFPTTDPFLWQNGHMTDLGTLGGDMGQTSWLNDRGEVVGFSFLAGDTTLHPFLWNGGPMVDLGTLGGSSGVASWVSNSGDVVGVAQTGAGSWDGFLWHDGKMVDLAPVDGAPQSSANSVNDQGEAVGNTLDANFNELAAVLWSDGHAYDLNTLVAPGTEHLTAAQYINDQGDIVSNAELPNGDQRMVELVRRPWVPLPLGSTAGPAVKVGVAGQSPTAEFALTAGRHGIKAAIRELMLRLNEQRP